jgi:hypothetical protein
LKTPNLLLLKVPLLLGTIMPRAVGPVLVLGAKSSRYTLIYELLLEITPGRCDVLSALTHALA